MKILIATFILSLLSAGSVTFNVDMSLEEITEGEGPTVWLGAFYPTPGFIMTDEDGDGVWSYTFSQLEAGTYTYKYRNGHWTSWNVGSGWEEVPSECEVGQWGDREFTFDGEEDLILDTVCFSSCTEECVEVIYSNVTFQVDMSDEDLSESDIVYIQGSFNGWCGYCNPMSDINDDDIWELTLTLPVGEYEYLFTTDGWNGLQGGAPIGSDCDWISDDAFGNYGFILEEQDLLLGPYCFETCWDTCQPPSPVDVTFSVDMNNQNVIDNVYIIGDFQMFPWSTTFFPTVMEDNDGDGIYSATISVLTDQIIEYKFVNGSEIESDEGIGNCGNNSNSSCNAPGPDCNNRVYQVPTCEIDLNDDCTLDAQTVETAFFNSCSIVVADVHFSIDLNYTGFPNEDYDQCGLNGSWNAEGDQWLGWGLNLLDEDNDGIFEGSLLGLPGGSYEYIVFCSGPADGWSGWGTLIGAPLGAECDFDSSDEYGNYGFTINQDSDLYVSHCAGSCEETCSLDCDPDLICAEVLTCFGTELYPTACGPDNCDTPIADTDGICSDNNIEYSVTFDIDGLDDCGFVSVTGTFDNWSGWGAHTDNDMTVMLQNGDYEFTILCVDTSINEWWNDIWSASTQYGPPLGSSCDWDSSDEYPNYGFTVNGSDLTVSYCLGTCNASCDSSCTNNGDVTDDGITNVVDLVSIVGYILGNNDYSTLEQCIADINQDGIVNVVDIVAIVSLILGS